MAFRVERRERIEGSLREPKMVGKRDDLEAAKRLAPADTDFVPQGTIGGHSTWRAEAGDGQYWIINEDLNF